MLNRIDRHLLQIIIIHHLGGFFIDHLFQRVFHLHSLTFGFVVAQVGKHALQLAGHLFHAGRGHDLDAHRGLAQIDIDLFVIQFAFAQLLAQQLPGGAVRFLLWLVIKACRTDGRQQGIKNAVFCGIFGAKFNFIHRLHAQHLDRHIHQVTDNGLYIAANIAYFGKLGGFHFDKRSVRQFCQAAGYFGFTHTGRADHEDVLGGDFSA